MSQRILVVDDEPDVRQLVTTILEDGGYQVAHASNGQEALQTVEAGGVDLVILDIMMPEMDGWEVCRQIKGGERTRSVPVMILSVRGQLLDKVIGLEVVQADDYLCKPFDNQELLGAVARLLSARPPTS